jgi:hypothetical protein
LLPPETTSLQKGAGDVLKKFENLCLIVVAGAYKVTLIRSIKAEVEVPPLIPHIDVIQACFRLKFPELRMDEVIRNGIFQVKHLLSCIRRYSR